MPRRPARERHLATPTAFDPSPNRAHLQPYQLEITPAAKQTAIQSMKELLERRTGRPHNYEEARQAFENLHGYYKLMSEWAAKADAEDPGWRTRPPKEPVKQRTFTKKKRPKAPPTEP